MVGGVAAFVGALILGPRIGKFTKDGKPKAIPGHSLTLGALGVFILWFAWFGFNAGSTISMSGDSILAAANIFVTTNIGAAVAATTVMCITWIKYKKPDVSMTLNGALAGLVAITAGCDAVSPLGAAAIGLIAGFIVVFGIEFIEKKLKIDDPVGAIGVHGLCGAAGTIMTGLFAVDGGLFYGGGFRMLGVQSLGVVSVAAWVAVTMTVVFLVIKYTIGLRVSAKEEISGLDKEEHGLVSCYADFVPMPIGVDFRPSMDAVESASSGDEFASFGSETVSPDIAIPTTYAPASAINAKMSKVVVITNQSKFELLKGELDKIGITGMTVSQVMGCGYQKGSTEFYRGVPLETTLLPKVKVEIVVCKVPVKLLVDTIKRALYTGNIGDGKIFVYNVENVIKVRTGEEGYDALQDVE
ncbi:MAG: adenylate cyclase, partial [Clostridia bacterium]|nr:adenylate cyclase [Clostridia bacterium]